MRNGNSAALRCGRARTGYYRALAALAALLLAWTAGWAAARAEEAAAALDVAVRLTPETVAAPGEVEMTFTLTNLSGDELAGVRIAFADGLFAETVGDLAADETREVTCAHAVTQAELDAGTIDCTVSWETEDGGASVSVAAPLAPGAAEPSLTLLREISARQVAPGGAATIVYRVENSGAAADDVVISDPGVGFEAELDALAAGGSETFVHRAAVDGSAVSEPVLTYAAGDETHSLRLEAAALEEAQGRLSAELTAGVSMFDSDKAEAVLRLTNAGAVDYVGLTIYDDAYGGVIADGIDVPAGGEPVEVAHTYPLRGDAVYRWRIVGANATGARVDFVTDDQAVADPAGEPALALRAEPSLPHICRAGYVTFTVEVANFGDEPALRAVISEASRGEVAQLAVVPTGEPTACEVRLEVEQSADFAFTVAYEDAAGGTHSAFAEPVRVEVAPGGAEPEPEDIEEALFDGAPAQVGESPLFTALLIGSCAVLAALVAALVILSVRARRAKRERAAAQKQRIKEEMGKTARFVPLRRAKKGKQG